MIYTADAEVAGSAVADPAGVATVTLNGPGVGYIAVDSIALDMIGTGAIPTCTVYAGVGGASGRVLASRRQGDRGTFRGTTADRLQAGQSYTVQWTGATPGVTLYAVLRGTAYRQG